MGEKKGLKWEGLLTLGLVYMLSVAGCKAGPVGTAKLGASPNNKPLAEIHLSARAFEEEILGEFVLEESATVDIVYTLENIDTEYFNLTLHGPKGTSFLILRSEDFRTDENGGGHWNHELRPGVYRLLLTADQSPGFLSIYYSQTPGL